MTPYQAQLARQIPLDSGMKRGGDYGERRDPRAGNRMPLRGVQLRPGLRTISNSTGMREVVVRQPLGHDAAPPPRPAADQEGNRSSSIPIAGNSWAHVPAPADAEASLRELYRRTGERDAWEAAESIAAMRQARQRAQAAGELRCTFCDRVIERHTLMGPPPEYCNRSCESRAYRQRKREEAAAEARRDADRAAAHQ